MREAFAHDATVTIAPGGDDGAPASARLDGPGGITTWHLHGSAPGDVLAPGREHAERLIRS